MNRPRPADTYAEWKRFERKLYFWAAVSIAAAIGSYFGGSQ